MKVNQLIEELKNVVNVEGDIEVYTQLYVLNSMGELVSGCTLESKNNQLFKIENEQTTKNKALFFDKVVSDRESK